MAAGPGRPRSQADQLILEIAAERRRLKPDELQHVLEHVARVGFDPGARERARGVLAGVAWQGVIVMGTDRLPPAVRHYLWHVVKRQEWPLDTTLEAYVESIRQVILDPASGVFVAQYQGTWQLSIVRRSGELRGPAGSDWVLVEYRLVTGHWTTAYQPESGLQAELRRPYWSNIRWLRRPRPIARST